MDHKILLESIRNGFYLFSPNVFLLELCFLESIEFFIPSKFRFLFTHGYEFQHILTKKSIRKQSSGRRNLIK